MRRARPHVTEEGMCGADRTSLGVPACRVPRTTRRLGRPGAATERPPDSRSEGTESHVQGRADSQSWGSHEPLGRGLDLHRWQRSGHARPTMGAKLYRNYTRVGGPSLRTAERSCRCSFGSDHGATRHVRSSASEPAAGPTGKVPTGGVGFRWATSSRKWPQDGPTRARAAPAARSKSPISGLRSGDPDRIRTDDLHRDRVAC